MTKLEILHKSSQKIFTVNDLAVLWQEPERKKLWEVIKYYVRQNRLQKVFRGVYALDENYSELELAVNVFPPSYVSFITALGIHGINFQYHESLHVMALASKTIQLPKGKKIMFHKLKNEILFNETGLQREDNYLLASPERAICDTLYLEPSYTFDNLQGINSELLTEIAKIYKNKALVKRIKKIAENIIAPTEGKNYA